MNPMAPVMAKKFQLSERKSELLRKCMPRIKIQNSDTLPHFCAIILKTYDLTKKLNCT